MKTTDVSRQATQTLSAIEETLRRAEDLTWDDPEFLEWERAQVGGIAFRETDCEIDLIYTEYWPPSGTPGLHTISPMIEIGEPGEAGSELASARTAADDYPPPESTTHGPLLLGPEPPTVGERADRGEWRGATADLVISDETLALYAGDAEALAQRYRTENGGAR